MSSALSHLPASSASLIASVQAGLVGFIRWTAPTMIELPLRILSLCIALAGAETIHGIVRMRVLVPRVGFKIAQRISIITGSLLASFLCFLFVPPMGLQARIHLLALGALLSTFMAAFDIIIGRFAARRPWRTVMSDFNPKNGNLLLFGLIWLVFSPWIVVTIGQ